MAMVVALLFVGFILGMAFEHIVRPIGPEKKPEIVASLNPHTISAEKEQDVRTSITFSFTPEVKKLIDRLTRENNIPRCELFRQSLALMVTVKEEARKGPVKVKLHREVEGGPPVEIEVVGF